MKMSISAISGIGGMGKIRFGLEREIRMRLEIVRRQGKKGWGEPTKQVSRGDAVKPAYPMFVEDRLEIGGRSAQYHEERIELMRARYERGESLWDGTPLAD